jgi:hypothetical protein
MKKWAKGKLFDLGPNSRQLVQRSGQRHSERMELRTVEIEMAVADGAGRPIPDGWFQIAKLKVLLRRNLAVR